MTSESILVFTCGVLAAGSAGAQTNGKIVIGSDQGYPPEIRLYDPLTGIETDSFVGFDSFYTNGMRVAVGDVNADGVADILATASAGGFTSLRVFDGTDYSIIHDFFPYGSIFGSRINIAAGDVNGDGFDDIITGPGEGTESNVRVFDGTDLSTIYDIPNVYDINFLGGVNVASGDINGDGFDDIVCGPGPGLANDVLLRAYDGSSGLLLSQAFAYSSLVSAGAYVACGDLDNDGLDEVIVGNDGPVPPLIRTFDGVNMVNTGFWFTFSTNNFGGGVRVACGDINNDGFDDIVGGAGQWPNNQIGPEVYLYDGGAIPGVSLLNNFYAGDPMTDFGVFVAGPWNPPCPADVNGDGVADPADFTAWLACFNDPMSAPYCDNADVNNDGTIDPADFTAWLASFNAGCP